MKLKSFEENTKEWTEASLPNGWIIKEIGDIFDISAGGDLDPERSQDLQDKDHNYPIYANAIVGPTTYGYSSYYDRKAGSITVTARGTLGFASFRDHDFKAIGRLLVLEPKMVVDGRFIAEYINTCINFLIESTGVPQLTAPQISKYQLLIPPLPEQHAIANIAMSWDNASTVLSDLITAKEVRKKALMQQLLTGKRRLPGFEDDWQYVSYQNILQEVKRPVNWDDDAKYDLISVRRRSGGLFHRDSLHGREILTKNLRTANTGDFLISKMQIVHGASGLVTPEFDGMKISGSYIAVRAKSPKVLDMRFFNWMSKLPTFYHQTLISSYGVHIEKMTFDFAIFLRLGTNIPKLAEQVAIVNFLETAEHELCLMDQKLTALNQQKKGLMQKLLTGKIRLKTE